MLSTDLYRRGEFSRSANDEAVAVLGAINQDLDRLVPPGAGGWFYSQVVDDDGDCLVAFTISLDTNVRLNDQGTGMEFTNRSAASAAGNASSRQIVVWWASGRSLYRDTLAWNPHGDPNQLYQAVERLATAPTGSLAGGMGRATITTGCLHFGTWLSFDSINRQFPRRVDIYSWETGRPGESDVLPHRRGGGYDSAPTTSGDVPPPYPQALRLTLALTGGGRHVPKGMLISDDGDTIRVNGLGGLPIAEGSNYMRIGDEWIRYKSTRGIVVDCSDGRGARRSRKESHIRGAAVEVGLQYSLVRSIGR
jgi:hypothetical protein